MWTGKNLQLTVMSLKPGEEIGLEKHDVGDQFIRVEQGNARVVMGAMKNKMTFNTILLTREIIFSSFMFYMRPLSTLLEQ